MLSEAVLAEPNPPATLWYIDATRFAQGKGLVKLTDAKWIPGSKARQGVLWRHHYYFNANLYASKQDARREAQKIVERLIREENDRHQAKLKKLRAVLHELEPGE